MLLLDDRAYEPQAFGRGSQAFGRVVDQAFALEEKERLLEPLTGPTKVGHECVAGRGRPIQPFEDQSGGKPAAAPTECEGAAQDAFARYG